MLWKQVEQYADLLDQSEVPVYIILGNHDMLVIGHHRQQPMPALRLFLKKPGASWMRNVPSLKDGTYYSRIFKVDTVTLRMIFLDNSYNHPRDL